MNFIDIDSEASGSIYDLIGQTASMHHVTGVVTTLKVIIDKDVEAFPGTFDSQVSERRTVIHMQKSDAPRPKAGELIRTTDTVYELADLVSDGDIEIVYTAQVQE